MGTVPKLANVNPYGIVEPRKNHPEATTKTYLLRQVVADRDLCGLPRTAVIAADDRCKRFDIAVDLMTSVHVNERQQ